MRKGCPCVQQRDEVVSATQSWVVSSYGPNPKDGVHVYGVMSMILVRCDMARTPTHLGYKHSWLQVTVHQVLSTHNQRAMQLLQHASLHGTHACDI